MKTFALIVTYNRLDSLKRVLNCVLNQTRKLDKIVVVNNDSTDGTQEWLEEQPGIQVIKQANLGGAGGFHTGVKECYEQGADWIWMMDDDVFPNDNCLEELFKYTNISNCLNITRYWSNGDYVPQYFYYDINYNVSRELEPNLEVDYQTMNTCCFEGLLISRDIVKKIGFPDSDFFIAGDDTIYGFLASSHTNVILVKNAIAIKLQSGLSPCPRPFYTYYKTRNHFLINNYKKLVTGRGFSLVSWFKYFKGVLFSAIKRFVIGQTEISRAILRGCFDGIKQKKGNTF